MALNIFRTIVFLFAILQCIRAWTLKGYKESFNNSIEVSWTNATQLIDKGYVSLDVTIAIWIFGFRGSETTQGTKEFVETTLSNSNWSVVVVNWPTEAGNVLIPNYISAAQNTQIVGAELGQAISTMVASGVNLNKIIVIGLSLGAHVSGVAGCTVKNIIGQSLPLIVGLDPAKPQFENPEVIRCIKSTDATTVLKIQTDEYRFGMSGKIGTHNFIANPIFYATHGHQPGCSLIEILFDAITAFETVNFIDLLFCSHRLAADYFIETIQNVCSIIGNQASSATAWVLRGGSPLNLLCLGYNITSSPKGNYYFRTDDKSPYGEGIDGTRPF